MEQLTDLKAILHSKRANIYYLEKCRIKQKEGRVLYLTDADTKKQYWNIPIANTTCILLGTGTSISQAAVRMLASAGVLIGFSGGGGTPLIAANEIEWFSPQSEYRPTEYVQGWMSFWFEEQQRLKVAKHFQVLRLDYLKKVWTKDQDLKNQGFNANEAEISNALELSKTEIQNAPNVTDLLTAEGRLTKKLYRIAVNHTTQSPFKRDQNNQEGADAFLNHGNYLAYGLAATTLWVLGIPHGFAVMHGKTRRGALVFDIADLVKDALILPWAFICIKEQATEQEFRQQCLQNFTQHKALDFMFDSVKDMALKGKNL